MSKADYIYLKTTNNILKNGSWDTKEIVRPKWPDGKSAHTAKVFAVNNVYNLATEFPIVTLRFTNWKAAVDEILWIWQKKSNNVHDLNSHIWDQWADQNGSIGKAYGYQVAQKSKYSEGEFDQIDRIIWYLKNKPAFRSMVTELFVHKDLHEMGLYPCVHGMQLDVTDGKLNMFLNQRSNDTLAAGSWNVVQYAALLHMLAKQSNLKAGVLSHMIVNSHIYDRHIPFVVDLTLSRAKDIENRAVNIMETSASEHYEKDSNFFWFCSFLMSNEVDYDALIKEAQDLEKFSGDFDYESYTKRVVESKAFIKASQIIDKMLENPEFERFLGYKTPKLILDESVKSFYDYKSPLKTNETGKIVENEDSSFKLEDYDYQNEGIKLQARVPVAE